jgi:hypothetical protein
MPSEQVQLPLLHKVQLTGCCPHVSAAGDSDDCHLQQKRPRQADLAHVSSDDELPLLRRQPRAPDSVQAMASLSRIPTVCEPTPKPVRNLGNTCYMTVVLQALLSCAHIRSFFLSGTVPEHAAVLDGNEHVVPAQLVLKALVCSHRQSLSSMEVAPADLEDSLCIRAGSTTLGLSLFTLKLMTTCTPLRAAMKQGMVPCEGRCS